MRRINLSPPEQAALESTFKTTTDRRLRDRSQAVLMASRGRKRTEIAQDLGVHRSTVILWLKRYHQRGLAGLQIQWAPGKTRRIPEELAPTIQEWVKKGPQSCGLDRANWTYEELAVYLYQQTGIDVKRSAMQDFCQSHQMRPYRPTYRYLRGDPDKQQTAREEIAALKKAEIGQGVLLSQDEARFPLTPTLRATLGVKGHRPRVGTWDHKDLVYCDGALHVTHGKLTTRWWEQPARIKQQTGQSKTRRLQVAFAAHLHDMARAYPAESHPDVVIIMDHAPWHQGAIVEEAMAARPHLRFYRLPSYRPQLNPMERCWRILRRRIPT